MHLLVVGGGSAGHVIPALPIIDEFIAAGDQVSFVGTYSGLEESLLADSEVNFYAISAGKLRRYWSWQNVADGFLVLLGVVQSIWLVGRLGPDVVFSKGGFVSFPVAVASWLWRVPLLSHESDLTPGLANRLVLPFTRVLCVSFAATQDHIKQTAKVRVVHTGTPVRDSVLGGDASRGRNLLGLKDQRPLLVVTGGSLGADRLNDAIRRAAKELTQIYTVLHVCGVGKLVQINLPNYQQEEYIGDSWGDILAAADVVVSRAGANALFELLALRKLNVLVPLSAQASRGDQIENAHFAQRQGLSEVIFEEDLDTPSLLAALVKVSDPQAGYANKLALFEVPNATESIVDELRILGNL